MEKVDLIGKFVRTVGDGVDNTSILSFMYPDFIVKDEVFYDKGNKIIYNGKNYQGLKEDLVTGTKQYIAIMNTGVSDIDFTDRATIINVLYSKWNKEPKEEVLNVIDTMTDFDFWKYFKEYWITGKSVIESADTSLFDLYTVLGKQRHDIMKVYFRLKEFYPDNYIFSGILSFLEKSMNLDDISVKSGRYLKMLQDFNREYKDKIVPIIQRAYTMVAVSKEGKEYRTFWLLMQLGKVAMI